jgi:hypothetical protein
VLLRFIQSLSVPSPPLTHTNNTTTPTLQASDKSFYYEDTYKEQESPTNNIMDTYTSYQNNPGPGNNYSALLGDEVDTEAGGGGVMGVLNANNETSPNVLNRNTNAIDHDINTNGSKKRTSQLLLCFIVVCVLIPALLFLTAKFTPINPVDRLISLERLRAPTSAGDCYTDCVT